MGTKHPTRTLIILGFTGLLLVSATWCAGFFYWQLTLSAAARNLHLQIEQLARQPGEFPYEELEHRPQFDYAMSRGVPILLQEIGRALSSKDKVTACILIHYLSTAVAHADYHGEFEMNPSPHIPLTSAQESLEDLRIAHRINCEWWEGNRRNYPPWWMWWSGSRRGS